VRAEHCIASHRIDAALAGPSRRAAAPGSDEREEIRIPMRGDGWNAWLIPMAWRSCRSVHFSVEGGLEGDALDSQQR